MNLPNKLTLSRFYLTMFFVASLSVSFPYCKTVAFILFVIASITDYLDGEIARSQNLITDFGKLMDPLVDKIMTAAAFICLIPTGAIPAWVAIVIIAREFLITGLRLLATAKGLILSAERLGKYKTSWQIATILYFLLIQAGGEWLPLPVGNVYYDGFRFFMDKLMISVTVVLTLYSGIGYYWKNRSLITSK